MEGDSPLLALPFELRLQIYSHALSNFALAMRRTGSVGHNAVLPHHHTSYTALNLLLVCKQVRDEALPVLHHNPKALAFKMHFIERLEILPTIPAAYKDSIRVVLFTSRSGSQRLLEKLPNLAAVAVCRNALTRSPDLVWLGTGSLASLREWMISFIQADKFVLSLSQQWLLHYYYRSPGRKTVWCRVIATRSQSVIKATDAKEHLVKQAVWVNLDERGSPERWKWCQPTKHEVRGLSQNLHPAKYNPPLEIDTDDENLSMVCKWWTAPQQAEVANAAKSERPGSSDSHRGVPFCWNGSRVYA